MKSVDLKCLIESRRTALVGLGLAFATVTCIGRCGDNAIAHYNLGYALQYSGQTNLLPRNQELLRRYQNGRPCREAG